MSSLTRRDFLQGTLAAAAPSPGRHQVFRPVLGANDTIRIAVAGLNGRGGPRREFGRIKASRSWP